MSDKEHKPELLLGKQIAVSEGYAPELLYPIPREQARTTLGLNEKALPFCGEDIWHAYELSWLDTQGCPQSRVGRFRIPAHSPCLVESKSFKLYLNSLNQERFDSEGSYIARVCGDIAAVAGSPLELELFCIEDPQLAGQPLPGESLDALAVAWQAGEPDAAQIQATSRRSEQQLHTHLLRSLCPVTGQPDWASLWLYFEGPTVDRESLLAYLLAYRNHQEFHEQCVERIFRDISCVLAPEFLHVQAFYTRRGGLDITPFRSTGGLAPLSRMNRQ